MELNYDIFSCFCFFSWGCWFCLGNKFLKFLFFFFKIYIDNVCLRKYLKMFSRGYGEVGCRG